MNTFGSNDFTFEQKYVKIYKSDLYKKLTHQYIHAYYSKKSIPYSQAFRLNRIYSILEAFNNRYDQLESWLIFESVPIVGFRKGKRFKDHFFGA